MSRCKIPAGCGRADTPCCVDCNNMVCPARCRNLPEWCGCWEKSPPPTGGVKGKGAEKRGYA